MREAATYDADDRQAVEEELVEEGVVFGRRRYRRYGGAEMERLWHDQAMPVAGLEPEAAWRSIVEPEPPSESELYDRRNGFGLFWGRGEPAVGPDATAPWIRDLDKAGVGRALAIAVPLGLLFLAAGVAGEER